MLDPKEIDIEIARLEYGESSYPAYAKLATLYTIKNQMQKQEPEMQNRTYEQAYSAAPAEIPVEVGRYGDSEFLREVEGRNEEQVKRNPRTFAALGFSLVETTGLEPVTSCA